MIMSGYKKPRVVCPYCEAAGAKNADGTPRHFTINGMTAHVRASHPGDYQDWHANKEKYVASHACDDNGVLTKGGSPPPGSFPEPEPEPGIDDDEEYEIEELDDEEDPEPDPKPKPRKQRKREPAPEPDPEPEPGVFRKLALDLGFKDN